MRPPRCPSPRRVHPTMRHRMQGVRWTQIMICKSLAQPKTRCHTAFASREGSSSPSLRGRSSWSGAMKSNAHRHWRRARYAHWSDRERFRWVAKATEVAGPTAGSDEIDIAKLKSFNVSRAVRPSCLAHRRERHEARAFRSRGQKALFVLAGNSVPPGPTFPFLLKEDVEGVRHHVVRCPGRCECLA